jgi:hypothetical protein
MEVTTMGLSDKKEEQLRDMPIVESRYFLSEDGKYIVHKTTFTDIKPVLYLEKVLAGPERGEHAKKLEVEA